MTQRVLIIRHGEDPPDDRVHTYVVEAGYEPDIRRPFKGEPLGDIDGSVAGTVIHGGPFNAYDTDKHPFLADEYRWIDQSLKADIPVLGICQGAQMIAYHLGAEVGATSEGKAEFGYYRIDPSEGAEDFMTVPVWCVQSHFHTFSIPDGAKHLASSALFPNQAFSVGEKVYGLQFHPEVTIEGFRRWQQRESWLEGRPGIQAKEEQNALMAAHDAAQADWFYAFLSKLFGRAGDP